MVVGPEAKETAAQIASRIRPLERELQLACTNLLEIWIVRHGNWQAVVAASFRDTPNCELPVKWLRDASNYL
jgi:hypothetical protein